MKNVEQILKTKSQHQTVYTIGPDDSVLDALKVLAENCLLYTSPSPRDGLLSRMPSSA